MVRRYFCDPRFYYSRFNKKRRKSQKDGIIKRIDTFINLLFWFLLVAYGLTFLYWLYRAIF